MTSSMPRSSSSSRSAFGCAFTCRRSPASRCDAYILHRLEVAGSQGREIFASDTFELLFRYTGGVPRLTNTLCDTAMLAAANHEPRHRQPR